MGKVAKTVAEPNYLLEKYVFKTKKIILKPLLKPFKYNKPRFKTAFLRENVKTIGLVKSSPTCCHIWATFFQKENYLGLLKVAQMGIFAQFGHTDIMSHNIQVK